MKQKIAILFYLSFGARGIRQVDLTMFTLFVILYPFLLLTDGQCCFRVFGLE